jgi:hypothetical protein
MPDYMIPYLASYHWGDLSKPTKKTKYKKKMLSDSDGEVEEKTKKQMDELA